MKRSTFYRCPHCGNIAIKVHDAGVPLVCCGVPMEVIEPNTVDAAAEKHVPAVELDGDILKVSVGAAPHPMEEEHFIQWIYVVTEEGAMARCLNPGEAPAAEFALGGQTPIAVYEFCNKHGIWKTEL